MFAVHSESVAMALTYSGSAAEALVQGFDVSANALEIIVGEHEPCKRVLLLRSKRLRAMDSDA